MTSACISRLAQLQGHLAKSTVRGMATEANPLLLYDLKTNTNPPKAWSPNTWKTRLVLNYKKIPYKTVWLSFAELESTLRDLGFQPSAISTRTGREFWTVPAIADPSSDPEHPTLVVDSHVIAEYLDAKYPQDPIFPSGSRVLQSYFIKWTNEAILGSFSPLIAPRTPLILDEPAIDFFVRTRTERFGKELHAVCRGEERAQVWAKLKKELDTLDRELARNDGDFVMGSQLSYGDIVIVAHFLWAINVPACEDDGPDAVNVFDVMKDWHNGRWTRLVQHLAPFMEEK